MDSLFETRIFDCNVTLINYTHLVDKVAKNYVFQNKKGATFCTIQLIL